MSAIMVYVTAGGRDEATKLAHAVIDERLAACVNILPEITAVFRWEGAVSEGAETAMIMKSTGALLPKLTARIKELHSYDCPCVVAIPIEGGNKAFIKWIADETA